MSVKVGTYYRTSWGYDQTNYDFLIVVGMSPSGKTATCRMVRPIHVGEAGQCDMLTPGTAYGPTFKMQVRNGNLRGSYPYIAGLPEERRLDTFEPTRLGEVAYQTMPQFGH